ncbi:MAG: phosphoribosylanthranilate isomerase [Conexibacter sp.]|nr:phosphoribosylanthranilate isomerase [Conexibacter sp.]
MQGVAHRAPRIKFCGITSVADGELAVANGAWAIGLILWPQSKRACDPAEGIKIAGALRRKVEVCGVFVNQSLDEIAAYADMLQLSMVQLHGEEGPAFATEVRRRTGAKVIKAQSVRLASDILKIQAFHAIDYHLLDTYREGERGGTGETFDWRMLERRSTDVPLILSGGLNAENVAEAIAAADPFAVDVASGTEASPGVKDPSKMKAFADAVRATADEPEPAPRVHASSETPAGRRSPVRPASA